jgi:hypothetical protein
MLPGFRNGFTLTELIKSLGNSAPRRNSRFVAGQRKRSDPLGYEYRRLAAVLTQDLIGASPKFAVGYHPLSSPSPEQWLRSGAFGKGALLGAGCHVTFAFGIFGDGSGGCRRALRELALRILTRRGQRRRGQQSGGGQSEDQLHGMLS